MQFFSQYFGCLGSHFKDVRMTALEHSTEMFFLSPDSTQFLVRLFTMTSSRQGGLLTLIRVVEHTLNLSN